MYPVELFNTQWFASDAPDQIAFAGTEIIGEWDGSKYVFVGAFDSETSSGDLLLTPEEAGWILDGTEDAQGIFEYVSGCLFASQVDLVLGGEAIITSSFDLFEDSYQVTIGDNPPTTVVRQSLCTWSGQGAVLRAPNWNFLDFEQTHKWRVNGQIKQGRQNDPVGTYEQGIVVE
jgi:hypothetical protein